MLQVECWFLDNNPTVDHTKRTNITFPGHKAVSLEIFANHLFLRQVSDFGPISAVQHVVSRHSLQVECWFLDSSPPMNHIPNEENGGPTSVRGPICAPKIIATKLGKSRVLGVNLGVNFFCQFHFHLSPRSHGIEARERGQRIRQWTYQAWRKFFLSWRYDWEKERGKSVVRSPRNRFATKRGPIWALK